MAISTPLETLPQRVNSIPIFSATGTPFSISVSKRLCESSMEVCVVKPTTSHNTGIKSAPTIALLSQRERPMPSCGSRRSFSRNNVFTTTPVAQMSMGMQIRNSSAMPAPSPRCGSNTIARMGMANTVTGLARYIRNARPIRDSK